jgi:hypothetical protein
VTYELPDYLIGASPSVTVLLLAAHFGDQIGAETALLMARAAAPGCDEVVLEEDLADMTGELALAQRWEDDPRATADEQGFVRNWGMARWDDLAAYKADRLRRSARLTAELTASQSLTAELKRALAASS